jgi:hypothetical protein
MPDAISAPPATVLALVGDDRRDRRRRPATPDSQSADPQATTSSPSTVIAAPAPPQSPDSPDSELLFAASLIATDLPVASTYGRKAPPPDWAPPDSPFHLRDKLV